MSTRSSVNERTGFAAELKELCSCLGGPLKEGGLERLAGLGSTTGVLWFDCFDELLNCDFDAVICYGTAIFFGSTLSTFRLISFFIVSLKSRGSFVSLSTNAIFGFVGTSCGFGLSCSVTKRTRSRGSSSSSRPISPSYSSSSSCSNRVIHWVYAPTPPL